MEEMLKKLENQAMDTIAAAADLKELEEVRLTFWAKGSTHRRPQADGDHAPEERRGWVNWPMRSGML